MQSVDKVLDGIFYSKTFEKVEKWVELLSPPPQFAAILFFAIMGVLWALAMGPCPCR
jgi:hypothetical protein